MITRWDFYIGLLVIAGIIVGLHFSTNSTILEIKKARIETRDSILQVQRDSALTRAMKMDIKSDSLQSVLNRHKLDDSLINVKYAKIIKKTRGLSADSSLQLFLRSTR